MENYLLTINDVNRRKSFTRLRISAHQLHMEAGRHKRPRKTPSEDRLCMYCNLGLVEDEEHFIMTCPLYENQRKELFDQLTSISTFPDLTDGEKFLFIMSCLNGDSEIIVLVTNFVNKCFEMRESVTQCP